MVTEDFELLSEWERNKRKNPFILCPVREARRCRLEAEEILKEARHNLESSVQNEKGAINTNTTVGF